MNISIHAPTRGATALKSPIAEIEDFNPRSHERSDINKAVKTIDWKISIHAPTRGATTVEGIKKLLDKFQSTLPREERRICSVGSTHEYTKFQSTLPREERQFPQPVPLDKTIFQSTLPREERLHPLYGCPIISDISIHAPTRGATTYIGSGLPYHPDFNPRSHERSDDKTGFCSSAYLQFQSTLPREERRCTTGTTYLISAYFNPRSHERSDNRAATSYAGCSISIHAPTRGATSGNEKHYYRN